MDLSNLMGMFGDVQAKMEEAKANLDKIIITEERNGISITISAIATITSPVTAIAVVLCFCRKTSAQEQ